MRPDVLATPGLAYPGGGIFFWWQAGAVAALNRSYRLAEVPCVGASAGALAATLGACARSVGDTAARAFTPGRATSDVVEAPPVSGRSRWDVVATLRVGGGGGDGGGQRRQRAPRPLRCEVDMGAALDVAARLADERELWTRGAWGLSGIWGPMVRVAREAPREYHVYSQLMPRVYSRPHTSPQVRAWLDELLPMDAAERTRGRLHVRWDGGGGGSAKWEGVYTPECTTWPLQSITLPLQHSRSPNPELRTKRSRGRLHVLSAGVGRRYTSVVWWRFAVSCQKCCSSTPSHGATHPRAPN